MDYQGENLGNDLLALVERLQAFWDKTAISPRYDPTRDGVAKTVVLAIDRRTLWAQVQPVLAWTVASAEQGILVIGAPAPESPPDSKVTSRLATIMAMNARESSQALRKILAEVLGTCAPGPGQDLDWESYDWLRQGLARCNCDLDFESLRSVMYAVTGAGGERSGQNPLLLPRSDPSAAPMCFSPQSQWEEVLDEVLSAANASTIALCTEPRHRGPRR
jgi:hypothetical protein